MIVLFDARWTPELAPSDEDEKDVVDFLSLERTAERIDKAIQRTFVWAEYKKLGEQKFVVRDVRILVEEIPEHERTHGKVMMVVCSERLQVLLLEGWRTPDRVWADEESVEVIEGVQ